MTIRFAEIGDRLRAFRMGSGLSADEVAARIGISRTALYRFEKGEVAKIEALEKLADLLEVSVPTLLGVGVAYLVSAAVFAEVIFARPGIGALIVQAVDSRNYPIVMGCVLITTVLFVVATMISDMVNALLDPRVREGY